MIDLSTIASTLAGRPVTVECVQRPLQANGIENPKAIGWVWFTNGKAGDTIYLRMGTCNALQRPLDAPYDASVGAAMQALAHEAIHASGVQDEATTECLAHRNIWQIVRQFKLPARAARWALNEADAAHSQLVGDPYYAEDCP